MVQTSGGSCVQNADYGSSTYVKTFLLTVILVMMLSVDVCGRLVGYFVDKLQENGDKQSELETEIFA